MKKFLAACLLTLIVTTFSLPALAQRVSSKWDLPDRLQVNVGTFFLDDVDTKTVLRSTRFRPASSSALIKTWALRNGMSRPGLTGFTASTAAIGSTSATCRSSVMARILLVSIFPAESLTGRSTKARS